MLIRHIRVARKVLDNGILTIAVVENLTNFAVPILVLIFLSWEVYRFERRKRVDQSVRREMRKPQPVLVQM